jgi:PncC family amidohydrolase
MFTDDLRREAAALIDGCRRKGIKLTVAESCTGGLLCALITDIPGASDVFDCGFVAYSYASKTALLGVDADLVIEAGAVSDQVVAAMADGARKRAHADLAVAITGIAGPGGGTKEKPVGLVYIATAAHDSVVVENNHFTGSRGEIRMQSVKKALAMLNDHLDRSFVSAA